VARRRGGALAVLLGLSGVQCLSLNEQDISVSSGGMSAAAGSSTAGNALESASKGVGAAGEPESGGPQGNDAGSQATGGNSAGTAGSGGKGGPVSTGGQGGQMSVGTAGGDATGEGGAANGGSPECTETDQDFCTRMLAECGPMQGEDLCGTHRNADCGKCPFGECEGNACSCQPETDTKFCTRQGKTCGFLDGIDNCGKSRSFVQCGECEAGACGADNICCARDAKNALECPGTEVLARSQGGPAGIAVDDEHLFWTSTTDGTILRANLDGSSRTTIAFGQANPAAIALSDTHVFWTASDVVDPLARVNGARIGVRRAPKSGGQAAVAAVSPRDPFTGHTFDLLYVAGFVYWTERINSAVDTLIMAPIGASAGLGQYLVTNYTEPQTMRQTLASDGSSIVWAMSQDVFSDAGVLWRADVGQTSGSKIFSSAVPIGGIDILGNRVFFPNAVQDTSSPTEPWDMKWVDTAGGAPESQSIPWEHYGSLGWDEGVRCLMLAENLVLIAINGGGGPSWALQTLALDTGKTQYVADVDGGPGDFAVSNGYVYWTEPATGRVLRAEL
jgi:hypothetical protein